jgi:hypothetical protein
MSSKDFLENGAFDPDDGKAYVLNPKLMSVLFQPNYGDLLTNPIMERMLRFVGDFKSFDPKRPSNPLVLEEANNYIDSNKGIMMKWFSFSNFRKNFEPICSEMSPLDSFEFRLSSRLEAHKSPYIVEKRNVKMGISYNVINADWISPEGDGFREFIQNDDRYRIDFDLLVKSKNHGFEAPRVLFMPNEPLPHMLDGASKKNDSAQLNPHRPSDQAVLRKAARSLKKAQSAYWNFVVLFRQELAAICLFMAIKDSFIVRLRSWNWFDDGTVFEDLVEVEGGFACRVYGIEWYIKYEKSFREFVESDPRYTVDWGGFVDSDKVGRVNGTIIAKPLPRSAAPRTRW